MGNEVLVPRETIFLGPDMGTMGLTYEKNYAYYFNYDGSQPRMIVYDLDLLVGTPPTPMVVSIFRLRDLADLADSLRPGGDND